MKADILTAGYEGASLTDFIATLQGAGVQVLVDARELPLSRRAGFSKRPLGAALAEAGIEYRHWKALGTPKEIRHAVKATGDYAAFRRDYLAHLDWLTGELEGLARLAAERRVAVMCFEADPRECHRSLIAERMQELGLLGAVEHLAVPAGGGS
ncbi:MAG TPA: DUF488 domain-containing protein [Deinococcales bacterium]|nr:DUF488 domain-containing protein [Deinococcales bacterium]